MSREYTTYIMPPAGFGISSEKVWKLKRPVYGLSSAPKAWHDRFLEVMEESGWALNSVTRECCVWWMQKQKS